MSFSPQSKTCWELRPSPPHVVRYIIIRIVMERQANWWVGVTSPFHSLFRKKANRRRKLALWPDYNTCAPRPFIGHLSTKVTYLRTGGTIG